MMFVCGTKGRDQLLRGRGRDTRCANGRACRARLSAHLRQSASDAGGAPLLLSGPLRTHGRTTEIRKQTTHRTHLVCPRQRQKEQKLQNLP